MSDQPPRLPAPRGPISEAILEALGRAPGPVGLPFLGDVDMLDDDDAQLALWCCYQLHYLSFAGVDDAWEWEPALLATRRTLERQFVARLTDEIGPPSAVPAAAVRSTLQALVKGDGPSLSTFLLEHGSRDQMREFLAHRSVYQRKEADPHTWAIPRLRGRAKAAMVTIQYDEYGKGVSDAMHAELFATTMRAFDLDPAFGAYLDVVPGSTLATDNLVTMFGLHRTWRAACVGHLALFEMTSVGPMGRYALALQLLGVDVAARRFYQVHVVADELHQHLALEDMVAGLLEEEPAVGGEVLFGAQALAFVESRFTRHLLDAWTDRRTSLLAPLLSERAAS